MTLTNLRDLMVDFMSLDLDNFRGESPTDPEKTEQLNRAYRMIAKRCALYDPKIAFTLALNTNRYPLRNADYATYFGARIVQPHYVTINGNPLYNFAQDAYGLWTMEELFARYPTWQTASSDEPNCAVYTGAHLIVHPKPNAAAVALTNHYIAGTYIPPDMSQDGDHPALPEELHEALAFCAAEYAAKPIATEAEMWNRIKEFRAEWFDLTEDVRQGNLRAIHATGTMHTERFEDYLYV